MKLSKKSEYACLALIDLARHYNKGDVHIIDISERNSIPQKYLEQILLMLKGAGYLRSKRGFEGGYRLSKNPKKITIAEIIRLIEGPLAPVGSASKYFYEHTPIEKSKKLLKLLKDIRAYIANKLENTTFSDLL